MAYTKQQIETIFNTICERVENGEALRSVLKGKDMPSNKTFYEWVDNDETKVKRYVRACEERANSIFEDIINISDNMEQDIITLPDGREVENKAVIARDRLRVDARKWAASKLNPKKYGDKIDQNINHSGEIKTSANNHTYEEMYFLKYGKKPE